MLQENRLLQIVRYLQERNTAALEELSNLTGVSIGTTRRDLSKLQESGILSMVRGGAVFRNADLTKQIFDMRSMEHKSEKQSLAQMLTEIISDGQAIALNSGTTNLEIAHFLVSHYQRLTVLTNNLRIMNILKAGDHFTLIVPGGVFAPQEHAIVGAQCAAEILTYNLDVALLAVNGLSPSKGITDFRLPEVEIAQAMLKASTTRVVVADHTKFGRISCMNICDLSEINYILTDSQVTEEHLDQCRAQGVRVLISPNGDVDHDIE